MKTLSERGVFSLGSCLQRVAEFETLMEMAELAELMDVLIVETAARGHVEAELAKISPRVRRVYLYPDKTLAEGLTEPTGLQTLEEYGNWDIAKTALVKFAEDKKDKDIGLVLVTADGPI